MSKLSYMVSEGYDAMRTGAKAGLVAAAIIVGAGGLEGCTTTTRGESHRGGPVVETTLPGGETSVTLSDDAEIAKIQKERIGKQMSKLLGPEFDRVTYSYMEFKEDDGIHIDLVLTGYVKDKYGEWAKWGINFDKICRSYMREKKIAGFIDISDYVIVDETSGSIVKSPEFKHYIAQQLNEVLNVYITNNVQACTDWNNFIKQNFGPDGSSN